MAAFYLVTFTLSLTLSLILTRSVRNLALARGWVSTPTLDGNFQGTPLPRLGGVAIFVAFMINVSAALLASWQFPRLQLRIPSQPLLTILVSSIFVFLIGIYADLRAVGRYFKFTAQVLAAILLFSAGLRISNLPLFFGAHRFPWFVELFFTVVWVLVITNAFNLIDGLDGLAAGSALFSTTVVFVVALVRQSSLVSLLTIVLAGAILGFLRYNFNPATIFLGDCGSLFIGFLLSALALESAQKAPTIIAVAIPVVSLGLPILETALSVLRRLISGRPVFKADSEQIHHKLLARGFSPRQVVIVLYAVSALFALLSLFLLWPTGSSLGLVLAVVGICIWLGVEHLGYVEFGELRRVAQRTIEQRQIVINNLAIRRATEQLKTACDYGRLCGILVDAFSTNDFDAFELTAQLLDSERARPDGEQTGHSDGMCFHWSKTGTPILSDSQAAWNLTLDLVTTANRRRGSMTIQRLYAPSDLHLDVNLLTSVFPVALADALDRVLAETPANRPLEAEWKSSRDWAVSTRTG